MPTVQQLTRSKLIDATVDLGDGDVMTITFDRNKVTPHWIDEADRRTEENDALALSSILSEVISSWDVTQENGDEFPPTRENLGLFSYAVHGELIRALIVNAQPSRAEGNDSSGPTASPSSDSTAQQQSSPNGPAPSESPTPSASPSQT